LSLHRRGGGAPDSVPLENRRGAVLPKGGPPRRRAHQVLGNFLEILQTTSTRRGERIICNERKKGNTSPNGEREGVVRRRRSQDGWPTEGGGEAFHCFGSDHPSIRYREEGERGGVTNVFWGGSSEPVPRKTIVFCRVKKEGSLIRRKAAPTRKRGKRVV